MLIETAALVIVLSQTPELCDAGERVYQLDSVTNSLNMKSLFLSLETTSTPVYSSDMESVLAADFATIPDVRHVILEHADGNLLVWIALDNPTREVRERVFQKQLSLLDGFPEIDFDFNIIPSLNRNPREFVSGGKVIFSRDSNAV